MKRKENINSSGTEDINSAIEDAYHEVVQEEVENDIAIFYNPEFDLVKEISASVPDLIEPEVVGTKVDKFEVVIAFNLQPPYRFSQEYFWLEVLAENEKAAVKTAEEWARISEVAFEITPLVRKSYPHDFQIGIGIKNKPLRVSWNLPIEKGTEVGTMIRHPATGARVGFLAYPEDEKKWLLNSQSGLYRLIVRKPSRNADPVVIAPVVTNILQ